MGASHAALVLAAHGSLLDPDASAPVFAHAAAIRERGWVGEVRETFWKEEPAFREVLRTVGPAEVYVVPVFMSAGYFVDRILPRELRLVEDTEIDVEKRVHLTPPVGTHPTMADVIIHRAENALNGRSTEDVGLAVVGHGTERHEGSDISTRAHADRLREQEQFATVQPFFLDESPRIGSVTRHMDTSEIVIVPLFVADGYHTKRDIPRAIGLRDGEHRRATEVDGRRLWYTGAVGTDPRIVDVILERAREAGATIPDRPRPQKGGDA